MRLLTAETRFCLLLETRLYIMNAVEQPPYVGGKGSQLGVIDTEVLYWSRIYLHTVGSSTCQG